MALKGFLCRAAVESCRSEVDMERSAVLSRSPAS